jgi:hypothetical protein
METNAVQREFDAGLEIWPVGTASDAMCRVYAVLNSQELSGDFQIAGTLTGPYCQYADTLPTTYSFAQRGTAASPLVEALVPEPCFWTPQMPQLYQAAVELRERDRVVAEVKRIFGIRRLAPSRHGLVFEAKHWVLRALVSDELPATDLAQWHDAETAMFVRNPSDALCDAASRQGVLLVAELGQAQTHEVARLARWPAVGIIALTGGSAERFRSGAAILAQHLPAQQPPVPASWATAALVDLSQGQPLDSRFAQWQMPLIALRPSGPLDTVAEGRRACDRLQRDLAHLGQFAGYIV